MPITPTYTRAFPSILQRSGPRQLTGRLVPYGEVAEVADPTPEGGFDIYREGFRPGVFSPQANTRSKGVLAKIGLTHRHEGGLGYLGPFTSLREEADGLWGDVAVLRSKADDVEDLLAAGVDELSVEFRLPRQGHTEVDDQGIRWRVRAHLDAVALEPKGAYSSAQVTAFRAEMDAEAAEVAAALREKEAAEAELKRAAEAEAEAILQRRRQWEQMTSRLDEDLKRQEDYIARYGLTRPGGFGTVNGR